MNICIYLRKSREDEELERNLGEGETLARHRKALFKYAKDKEYNILKVYEEIVSGESLIHRPAMLELLKDIEKKIYDAVLVMDMQRLGRGNMQEQGLILETFKKSNTKIITLQKAYDLNNEFDEEYSEFEAFMSRKEYRMITRRMQGGRVRSVEEGNYIATYPPFGYMIHETKNSRTLIPHPDQADVVRMVFDMYVNKGMGCRNIAKELNKLCFKSYTGKEWTNSPIVTMLKNPVYTGMLVWKRKCIKKSKDPNKVKDTYTRPESEWIVTKGKHEPIIAQDTFNKAQEILSNKYHIPYKLVNGPKNPLAGIVICGICGAKMILRPYGKSKPHIVCPKGCGNKSSRFDYLESKVLTALDMWLERYKLEIKDGKPQNNIATYQKSIAAIKKEITELGKQKLNIHDLLEKGVYTVELFMERQKYIADKISELELNISLVEQKIEKESGAKDIIPKIERLLELYNKSGNVQEKNTLLKSVLDKIVYLKEPHQKGDEYKLSVFPRHI